MRILVCVKQVPDAGELRLDPVTHDLVREGVPAVVNPCDAYALETAVRLREANGGSVALLSMGPPQAEAALKSCLAAGGDEAYLVCGREFAGADTLATARALAGAARRIESGNGAFDLILCGLKSSDGETAQVGPELAELLGLPPVTGAVEIAAEDGGFTILRETDEGYERVSVNAPCLVTVGKTAYEPRIPSIKGRMAAAKAKVAVFGAAELGLAPELVGKAGSRTRVLGTFPPKPRGKGEDVTAAELAALLRR